MRLFGWAENPAQAQWSLATIARTGETLMAVEYKKYLGETVDVKDQHRIDEGRLHAYLGDTIKGYKGPLTVKQF